MFGIVERPAAHEDRQLVEQAAFVLAQQLVAPCDGRQQRLLAWCRATARIAEEPKSVVQPRGDLVDGEGAHTGCREFEGEREPVESRAHLNDGTRVGLGNLEVAAGGSGALGEQAHRIELGNAFERRQAQRVRPVERRHAARVFAADFQRLAAGSQDAEMRTCAQEGGDKVGARIDQVLTVVQNE